jgi:hypothetical protein
MPLPTAIIAGVNKAGTTALFHTLASHSRVSASSVKETHYFSPARYGEALPPPSRYASYFAARKQADVVLEATPSYFYGGEPVASAIHDLLPEVKVILMLREPGSRAYSWWRFCRSGLLIEAGMDFSTYIRRCASLREDPEASRELLGFRGLSGGCYSRYLPTWQQTFGDRLLVVFHESWRERPRVCLEQIAAHIELELDEDVSAARTDNITVDISNRFVHRVALTVNNTGERAWRRFPTLKAILRQGYYALNARSQQDSMCESDREWLDDYYSDEIDRLRRLLPTASCLPSWIERA